MIAERRGLPLSVILVGAGVLSMAHGQTILKQFDERQVRAGSLTFRWSYAEVKRLEATTEAPADGKEVGVHFAQAGSTASFAASLEIE